MNTKKPIKTLIYCRTATNVQEHQMKQQEGYCRLHARDNKLDIVAIFHDKAISGNATDRPAFNKLLRYLSDHAKTERHAVIVADAARLARNTVKYLELKEVIANLGGDVQIAGLQGASQADTSFIETVLAAVAEHEEALEEGEREEQEHAD
ncbi:MAG: recombinase family protein [Pseudomonadota bacterium]